MDDLIALTTVDSGMEAELICQRLESEGIPATYLGRASSLKGGIPGGGVRVFGATIQVREQDAQRARELIRLAGGA
jgi:hypothetical protein